MSWVNQVQWLQIESRHYSDKGLLIKDCKLIKFEDSPSRCFWLSAFSPLPTLFANTQYIKVIKTLDCVVPA